MNEHLALPGADKSDLKLVMEVWRKGMFQSIDVFYFCNWMLARHARSSVLITNIFWIVGGHGFIVPQMPVLSKRDWCASVRRSHCDRTAFLRSSTEAACLPAARHGQTDSREQLGEMTYLSYGDPRSEGRAGNLSQGSWTSNSWYEIVYTIHEALTPANDETSCPTVPISFPRPDDPQPTTLTTEGPSTEGLANRYFIPHEGLKKFGTSVSPLVRIEERADGTEASGTRLVTEHSKNWRPY